MEPNKDAINPSSHKSSRTKSMEIIKQSVSMARRRLQLFRVLTYGGYGCVIGLILGAVCLLAARMWPIENVRYWAIGLFGISIIIGLVSGWLHRITLKQSAMIMDTAVDGEERSDMMVTALSFEELDTGPVVWQREQAAKYGLHFSKDMKKRMPRPRQRKLWLICVSMFVVVLIVSVLPNPKDKVLAERKQQEDWVKTQEKQVEDLSQKLKTTKLASLVKQPLQEQMDKLQEGLNGEKDPKQALDQLEKSMKAMEKLAKQQEMKEKSLSELAEKIRKVNQLSALAKSLQNNSKEELQKTMSELKKEIQKLTPEAKDKLRESLKKLAEETPTNAENQMIKDALKQLEQALEKGDASEQEKALQQLAEELAKAMEAKASSAEQSEAAAALSAALAQQGLGLAEQMAAAGLSYSDTWSSGGSAEMLAQAGATGNPGEGEPSDQQSALAGQGSTPGSGAGQGSGTGQGTGPDQGGSGGNGTGSGGSGGGSGAGLGSGGHDLVTTPRSFEGKDGLQSDGGPINGGGGNVQKGGTSPTIDGASRPYEEVYEEYAAEAKKSIGRNDLPQQMQGLVEEYFISINPNR